MSAFEDVFDFHLAYGVPSRYVPQIPPQEEADLRADLLWEEYVELIDAVEAGDLVEIADALADMQYIINGTALTYGINLDKVHAEVHRSNMSKLGEDGEPVRREDGKILKGPNYSPPDVRKVLGL